MTLEHMLGDLTGVTSVASGFRGGGGETLPETSKTHREERAWGTGNGPAAGGCRLRGDRYDPCSTGGLIRLEPPGGPSPPGSIFDLPASTGAGAAERLRRCPT